MGYKPPAPRPRGSPGTPHRRSGPLPAREPAPKASSSAEARFLELDRYRVDREWQRYEGTAQRELFRELRVRFLKKHPPPAAGPLLEVGPGPGRFTPHLGAARQPRLLLDLSQEALRQAARRAKSSSPDRLGPLYLVRGNGREPPLREAGFAGVYLLGNLVGFAAEGAAELLLASGRRVAPGGLLFLELSPGPGERSVYFHRLPARALARLLRAP
ncbi:MAG: class I SAM-dependent methyltransferase, partial [Thermoplasmata archaeon]|nr:class I SAM-dependent methyltransferase [Thermoplasmata archaeon]